MVSSTAASNRRTCSLCTGKGAGQALLGIVGFHGCFSGSWAHPQDLLPANILLSCMQTQSSVGLSSCAHLSVQPQGLDQGGCRLVFAGRLFRERGFAQMDVQQGLCLLCPIAAPLISAPAAAQPCGSHGN